MALDFLKLIDVKESYQAPIKIGKIMRDSEQRTKLFDSFLAEQSDLSFDLFTEFFQAEQADRKDKKQDYTPDGLVTVASELLGSTTSNADICAGTGGLTIKRWRDNPDARYYCEEFSDRAIPFLLFNLAIRNIDGIVWHGDSLTREEFATYKLSKGSQYSSIEKVNEKGLLDNNIKTDTVIMNPPYSMPWNPKPEYLQQPRFSEYEVLAPKSKSDYAFLLEGLYHLADNGTMSIILPHGILFRGQAEAKIRKQLIENNYIDAVIGLPDKLFLSTNIPTVVLVLKKNRTNHDVLFIDASKEFNKLNNKNELTRDNIDKIISTYKQRKSIDKYASVVSYEDFVENDFNLNIHRYVDTFEPEPVIPIGQTVKELFELDQEEQRLFSELSLSVNALVATQSLQDAHDLDKLKAYLNAKAKRKQVQAQQELL